ncbi:UDP-3-O-(3-hydroxymyristoyl)glucosamine N-acyltransferase [Chryseosolibacter indicus]|uniref:UDP-3-O-acylglucosamine N-acyltransferase n=1 Tax=Chryseosolibacter indicus TaxID=2782351 RepID=A0ABS5VMV0_9BACT|nr:UDP-3-O-(3-hydroxymyristoyl)glucosamine N-acyltransferase [Chryseosolibacter indicus]MBT1702446.1 UDP-3-O-(3-hydroxymyristoyl)glucosamine N-acyltransferase [Chryseosolibacter indicus]
MEFTINQVAALIGGQVKGNGDEKINMLAKIQEAKKGQIAFLSNPKYEPFIYTTQASAVIVKKDFQPKKEVQSTLILVDDPYVSFTALLEQYHQMITFQKVGVEQPSYISENAVVGSSVYRGAFSYIGNKVKIGNNVKIYPNAYIGDDVVIGDNTILYAGVKIYAGTRIGANCTVHSGAVIGSDGFGFAPQQDGTYKTIPQMGHVVLEDNVSIGANTVIDCATLMGDATTIRKGVKLDNLIQVAHNVEIGKNTVIAAQTGISGSSRIGENCIIGGQVGVAGHLKIANKTGIGAQAGILKSITEEGERILGSPAFDAKQYFQSYAVFKKLPELHSGLRDLEKKVDQLEGDKIDK